MQQVNFAASKYLTDKKCKLIFVPLRGQPKGHLEKEQYIFLFRMLHTIWMNLQLFLLIQKIHV